MLVGMTLAKNVAILLIEAFEVTAFQCITDLLRQIVIEIQIVRNGKAHTKRFLCLKQMTQIRARVVAAGRALAALVDRAIVTGVFFIHQRDLTVPGKQAAVTRVARRHHAVKEIHTAMHRLQNVAWGTYTHQITGLVLGHMRLDHINDAVHILGCLTHGKATDRITVKIKLCDLLHVLNAKILINSAAEKPLSDAEKELLARIDEHAKRFDDAMDDDLNTADAMGAIFELVKDGNVSLNAESSKEAVEKVLKKLLELTDVLGLLSKKAEDEFPAEIQAMLDERATARKEKNWRRSDELRDALAAAGYIVKDTPQGQKVTKA